MAKTIEGDFLHWQSPVTIEQLLGHGMECERRTMDYELRPATCDDYTYCYRLTKRNMQDLFCKHWGGWVPAEFCKGFVVENIAMVIIAGKRAGYLNIIRESTFIYIDNIQLSPAWQNQGIGTSLLNRLLDNHSRVSIRLTTFEDNPAKRLYERMGFVVLERNGMTVKMEKKAQQDGIPEPLTRTGDL